MGPTLMILVCRPLIGNLGLDNGTQRVGQLSQWLGVALYEFRSADLMKVLANASSVNGRLLGAAGSTPEDEAGREDAGRESNICGSRSASMMKERGEVPDSGGPGEKQTAQGS